MKYVYDDGSECYGEPPFPELSPKQLEAKALRDATPPQDTFARQMAAEEERKERQAEVDRIAAAAAAARANMVTAAVIEQQPQPQTEPEPAPTADPGTVAPQA